MQGEQELLGVIRARAVERKRQHIADGFGELKPFTEVNPYEPSEGDADLNEWLLYRPERWKDEVFEPEEEDQRVAEEEAEYEAAPRKKGKSKSKKILTSS